MVSTGTIKKFRSKIWSFYKKQKRSFPWRETNDPYAILVSEVMLQQTQTERVRAYYDRFLNEFPSVDVLAKTSLSQVLKLWQGLGYNRRAKFLHAGARYIVTHCNGVIPEEEEALQQIPGIGSYTAAAIRIFAFQKRAHCIETNIRTVFIHEFFSKKQKVHDKEVIALIERTLPKRDIRDWFYALMDYGAYLKKRGVKEHRKSAHYSKQSPFKGSKREIRGLILRILTKRRSASLSTLVKLTGKKRALLKDVSEQLVKEGFLASNQGYRLV